MKKIMILGALAAACFSITACAHAQTGAPILAHPERLAVAYDSRQDVTPPPGSSWSGAAFVDFANKEVSAIVANKLKELKHHGKPTGLELDGFTGAVILRDWKSVLGNSHPVVGLSVVFHKELFDSVDGFFGIGASASSGRAFGLGLTGGIRIAFDF